MCYMWYILEEETIRKGKHVVKRESLVKPVVEGVILE